MVTSNLVGCEDETWEVVLTGDICYEQPLAGRVEAWLRQLARCGAVVLTGDPGRTYLPKQGSKKWQPIRSKQQENLRTRMCVIPEHFRAKWTPVRVKKMRPNKNLECFRDSVEFENALVCARFLPTPNSER